MGTVEGLRGGSFFDWARQVLFYPLAPAVTVPGSAISLCQVPRAPPPQAPGRQQDAGVVGT